MRNLSGHAAGTKVGPSAWSRAGSPDLPTSFCWPCPLTVPAFWASLLRPPPPPPTHSLRSLTPFNPSLLLFPRPLLPTSKVADPWAEYKGRRNRYGVLTFAGPW